MSYGVGVFEPFWGNGPRYLIFMNLSDREDDAGNSVLDKRLNLLYTILESSPRKEIDEGIHALLTKPDWRPHLVGVMALLALKPANDRSQLEMLWQRLNEGSWASPQIVAALRLIDPEFEERGHRILSGKVPLGAEWGNEKVIAALSVFLLAVYEENPRDDGGNHIARRWADRVHELTGQGRMKIAAY